MTFPKKKVTTMKVVLPFSTFMTKIVLTCISVCVVTSFKKLIKFSEYRGVAQDVTLDIKVGIEAKNYEGVRIF